MGAGPDDLQQLRLRRPQRLGHPGPALTHPRAGGTRGFRGTTPGTRTLRRRRTLGWIRRRRGRTAARSSQATWSPSSGPAGALAGPRRHPAERDLERRARRRGRPGGGSGRRRGRRTAAACRRSARRRARRWRPTWAMRLAHQHARAASAARGSGRRRTTRRRSAPDAAGRHAGIERRPPRRRTGTAAGAGGRRPGPAAHCTRAVMRRRRAGSSACRPGLILYQACSTVPSLVDEERRADDAHVGAPVHLLLLPHVERLGDGVVGVGQQREARAPYFSANLSCLAGLSGLMPSTTVSPMSPRMSLQPAGLLRAARRVGLRVEVHEHLAAPERRQRDLVAVLVGQVEVGGLVSGLERHATTIGRPRDVARLPGRDQSSSARRGGGPVLSR